jgi:hypothetical protein
MFWVFSECKNNFTRPDQRHVNVIALSFDCRYYHERRNSGYADPRKTPSIKDFSDTLKVLTAIAVYIIIFAQLFYQT